MSERRRERRTRKTASPEAQHPADGGPRLNRSLAAAYHLLVLPERLAAGELAALLSWHESGAVLRREDEIALPGGGLLTGPWRVEPTFAAELEIPGTSAYVLRIPRERATASTGAMFGLDDIADAFPDGSPTGAEWRALEYLRVLARRLGGALRIADTGAIIAPDPRSMVDRLMRSDVLLDGTEIADLLDELGEVSVFGDSAAQAAGLTAVGILLPDEGGRQSQDMVTIEATTAAGTDPSAKAGVGWPDEGADAITAVPIGSHEVLYEVRLRPGRPDEVLGARPTSAGRRTRRRGAELVERAAGLLNDAVGGVVVDDDGFPRAAPS